MTPHRGKAGGKGREQGARAVAWAWKEKGRLDVQDILPWPPGGYVKDSRMKPGYVRVQIRELRPLRSRGRRGR